MVGSGGCVCRGMRGWCALGDSGVGNRGRRGSVGMKVRARRTVLRSESRERRKLWRLNSSQWKEGALLSLSMIVARVVAIAMVPSALNYS